MLRSDFWTAIDALVASSRVVIDRPRGTRHPRLPDFIYPLDYGFLEGTVSGDGAGIDIWRGTLPESIPTAVICAVDLQKRDMEMKLLLGCTPDEIVAILAIHNDGDQSALLVTRQ
jgi:inorganic pyrophosphatase